MTLVLCAGVTAEQAVETITLATREIVQVIIVVRAEEVAAEADHDLPFSIISMAADSLLSHRLPANNFDQDGLLLEDEQEVSEEPEAIQAGETLMNKLILNTLYN